MNMILGVLIMIGIPALTFFIIFSMLDRREEQRRTQANLRTSHLNQ